MGGGVSHETEGVFGQWQKLVVAHNNVHYKTLELIEITWNNSVNFSVDHP